MKKISFKKSALLVIMMSVMLSAAASSAFAQKTKTTSSDTQKTPSSSNIAPVEKTTGSIAPVEPVSNNTSAAPQKVTTLSNPLKVNSLSDLVLTFMKIISYLAVIFGVIMIMWVGLQLVMAQGKPDEITKRTHQLLWVVIGIGVILGARILVSVVINTLQSTGTVNPEIIQSAQNALKTQ